MEKATGWIIMTTGERPLAAVAADVTKRGFAAEQVLGEINMITGRCMPSKIASVRKVSGVTAVEPDASIDIGPPGAGETW